MLTARRNDKFDLVSQIPGHFTFSEAANNAIGTECHTWLECINLLIEHHCFADAVLLIACKMPVQLGIQWANWCIESVMPKELDQKNEENHPSVWVEAANFWHQQYRETHESHLENLAKEAVYSAVYLCAKANDFQQLSFIRILDKGLTLDHLQ